MTKKPNLLEQAFDHLSSIPYLNVRKVLKMAWVFSTVFFGFTILMEGLEIFNGLADIRPEWIKNLLLWAGVNPVFAYTLYLWNQRDMQNKTNNPEKNH